MINFLPVVVARFVVSTEIDPSARRGVRVVAAVDSPTEPDESTISNGHNGNGVVKGHEPRKADDANVRSMLFGNRGNVGIHVGVWRGRGKRNRDRGIGGVGAVVESQDIVALKQVDGTDSRTHF